MIRYYWWRGVLYDAEGNSLGERSSQYVMIMIRRSPEPIEVLYSEPPGL